MRIEHLYSPDQYARAVEEWKNILDVEGVHACADRGYAPGGSTVTDETLWELIWSDGAPTDRVEAHTVTLFSWSDYGGTAIDVANARYLASDKCGFDGWVQLTEDGPHGAGALSVPLGELPSTDLDTGLDMLTQLAAVMGATEVDGLLCSAALDDYVTELATAAWDQWLERDIPCQIAALIDQAGIAIPRVLLTYGYPVEDPSDYADWLWEVHEQRFKAAYYAHSEGHWACQSHSPTSVVNKAHDDAVRHAARTAFGWRI